MDQCIRKETTMVTKQEANFGKTEKVSNDSHKRTVVMHVLTTFRADPRVIRSATALKEAGYEVSVVDIVDQDTQIVELIFGISVTHLKVSNTFLRNRFRRWALIKALLMFIRSTLLLIKTSADIYHAHDFTALPACYIAAKLRGRPLIFDAHELPLSELDVPDRRWIRFFLRPFLAHMITRCVGGIGASPIYETILREQYHIPRVILLRNFPPYRPTMKSDRLRQQLGLGSSIRIALYQGNIQPDRGLDKIVRAAAFLENDIVIVMLGKGIEPTISQLKALVASEGVTDRVKLLPPVPYQELLDWTASADLGLTLIPRDGTLNMRTCLPNKLFEYLMVGLPVLTSPMDAVAPLVTSYDVGKVVHSLTPVDLGGAINAMLGDMAGLARMHLNGLKAAQQEFNWEKEKENLIHLYQDILTS